MPAYARLTSQFRFSLSEELHARLTKEAERRQISAAELVRELIDAGLPKAKRRK